MWLALTNQCLALTCGFTCCQSPHGLAAASEPISGHLSWAFASDPWGLMLAPRLRRAGSYSSFSPVTVSAWDYLVYLLCVSAH